MFVYYYIKVVSSVMVKETGKPSENHWPSMTCHKKICISRIWTQVERGMYLQACTLHYSTTNAQNRYWVREFACSCFSIDTRAFSWLPNSWTDRFIHLPWTYHINMNKLVNFQCVVTRLHSLKLRFFKTNKYFIKSNTITIKHKFIM